MPPVGEREDSFSPVGEREDRRSPPGDDVVMSGVSGPLVRAKTFLFIRPHGQVVKGLDCQSEFG